MRVLRVACCVLALGCIGRAQPTNLSPLALQPFLFPFVAPIAPVKKGLATLVPISTESRLQLVAAPALVTGGPAITLDWQQSGSSNVVGNNVYSCPDGLTVFLVSKLGPSTNFSFSAVPGTNQYAVTAVDSMGNESDFSNWIQFPMPAPATNVVISWGTVVRNVTILEEDLQGDEFPVTNVTGTNVVLQILQPAQFFRGATTDLPPAILQIQGQ